MLDRMDIWVYIPSVDIKAVNARNCMSTKEMLECIEKARKIQKDRYQNSQNYFNGRLNGKDVEKYCKLGAIERTFLNDIYGKNTISYRGYYKILKVARTIADIEGSEKITVAHLAEAAGYRNDWR